MSTLDDDDSELDDDDSDTEDFQERPAPTILFTCLDDLQLTDYQLKPCTHVLAVDSAAV
jgi:hypothetical protein